MGEGQSSPQTEQGTCGKPNAINQAGHTQSQTDSSHIHTNKAGRQAGEQTSERGTDKRVAVACRVLQALRASSGDLDAAAAWRHGGFPGASPMDLPAASVA